MLLPRDREVWQQSDLRPNGGRIEVANRCTPELRTTYKRMQDQFMARTIIVSLFGSVLEDMDVEISAEALRQSRWPRRILPKPELSHAED